MTCGAWYWNGESALANRNENRVLCLHGAFSWIANHQDDVAGSIYVNDLFVPHFRIWHFDAGVPDIVYTVSC